MTLYGLLILVIVFTVLIFFHELGHFLAAKMFRMKVEEFGFGLPFVFPQFKIRLFYDGETEYTIRALPIGGFVRIAGMEIEDATEESANDADKPRDGFNYRPLYQRFIVILAGPVFSFLLGWLTYCFIGAVVGVPDKTATSIAQVIPNSVAQSAGLREGETLTALNDKPVDSIKTALETIRQYPGKPLTLTLKDKSGATRQVTLTPREEIEGGEKVGKVGVQLQEIPLSMHRLGLGESFRLGTAATLIWFQEMGRLVKSGAIKDNVGGPVAIFSETQKAAEQGGVERPLMLIAQLSLSLGLANLLPIPVLDGGYLVLFMLEAVRRRKLTARQMERVMLGGLAVLFTLFVAVTFKDIRARFTAAPDAKAATSPAPAPSVAPAPR